MASGRRAQDIYRVITKCIQPAKQFHSSSPIKATFTATDAVMPKPHSSKITGLVGVGVMVFVGIATGAQISKHIANFLEENDLFVPSDDDDDD
ncbi:essential MCU regulator [Oratosquilla oratoria]|uniref:essential MCU regulator n=1 Tax=Oratosquilla oratoria TaxID=337810 RepID=UPI003F77405B